MYCKLCNFFEQLVVKKKENAVKTAEILRKRSTVTVSLPHSCDLYRLVTSIITKECSQPILPSSKLVNSICNYNYSGQSRFV